MLKNVNSTLCWLIFSSTKFANSQRQFASILARYPMHSFNWVQELRCESCAPGNVGVQLKFKGFIKFNSSMYIMLCVHKYVYTYHKMYQFWSSIFLSYQINYYISVTFIFWEGSNYTFELEFNSMKINLKIMRPWSVITSLVREFVFHLFFCQFSTSLFLHHPLPKTLQTVPITAYFWYCNLSN